MSDIKVLVADDDDSIRRVLTRALEKRGYAVLASKNGRETLDTFQAELIDLIFIDIFMPDANGLELMEKLKEVNPRAFIVVLTAHGTTQTAIEAMKKGAYDYITKPFDIEQVGLVADRALETARMSKELEDLRSEKRSDYDPENIVGNSIPMQAVYKAIGKVAASDVAVLLYGESGTGKELVARAIHLNSDRAKAPFVVVNCAAIPATLLESELFGHVKGSFTDATSTRIGKFERAHTGSIFLDEIAELSPNLQTKLLRVLQEKEIERVGSDFPRKIDVRIIAATNRKLENSIQEGSFREDLFYRLNVVSIHIPLLKNRKEDIPLLVEHFVRKFAPELNRKNVSISNEVIKLLMEYDWPGNVREVENVIKNALVMGVGELILPEHLPSFAKFEKRSTPENLNEILEVKLHFMVENYIDSGQRGNLYQAAISEVEKPLIELVLRYTKGNKLRAADLLGINRNTLRKKIEEYNLEG